MQEAMAPIFDVDLLVISKHLNIIFSEGEPHQDSVVSKMETTETISHINSRYNFVKKI